jgi:cytochrome c oxidase subunit 2
MSVLERHLWLATAIGLAALAVFIATLFVRLRLDAPARSGWRFQLTLTLPSTAIAIILFIVGFHGYVDAAVAPVEAIPITAAVVGGHWHFPSANGNSADDALSVPVDRPVQVTVRSDELPRRFEAPALHASIAVRPGTEGSVWFVARRTGESPLLCGDTCSGHPEMLSTVRVLDAVAWDELNDDGSKLPPAEYGRRLYAKATCATCHSLDGKPGTAPSFKGIFGKHEALADGSSVLVDEAYIRESILRPTAKVVRGFAPVMPPFAGQLEDKQIDALVAFIKTVKP